MKKFLFLSLLALLATVCFSQNNFSEETKKYILYDEPVIVLQNTLLIDGTGNPAKVHQTIIVDHGKISWLGDDAKAAIPQNARIIDLNGKAVTPGWVMLHEHMYLSAFSRDPFFTALRETPVTFPRLYLACGATTIRTTGSIEPYTDLSIKRDIDTGKLPGPHIDLTAPYMEGEKSILDGMAIIKTPEAAREFVNFWADQGFTSFKAYMFIEKPALQAAINEIHKRHLKITAHLGAVTYHEAAELGIDQLEHGFGVSSDFVPDKKENIYPGRKVVDISLARLNVHSNKVKNLLQYLIEKKVAITSTLAVFEGFTTSQPSPPSDMLDMFTPDSRDYYLKNYANVMSQKGPTISDSAYITNAKLEKMFFDMGGLLTVGTDPTGIGGTIAGYGNWRAIELLVESDGFTPLEAIKIATLNGAKALDMEKTIGTIERGKNADLIVIDGDPSKDIHEISKVICVFKDGVGYDSPKMISSVRGKVGFY